jgi:hypothetical protein
MIVGGKRSGTRHLSHDFDLIDHMISFTFQICTNLDLSHVATMDWSSGHPEKHAIITHLLKYRIPSKYIVPIDSILVNSIYGQHARKSARHRHEVQQLGLDISLDSDSRRVIYTAFESCKDQFDVNNAPMYFKTASDIAKLIYNGVEMVRSIGDQSYETLLW